MNKMLLALVASLCIVGCARKDDGPGSGVADVEVKSYPSTELTDEQKAKVAQGPQWKLPMQATTLYTNQYGSNVISRFVDSEFKTECYIFEKGDNIAISCVR